MNSPLTIRSDLSEKLHYNLKDYPIYTHKDELSRYGYAALCHWHLDLEFIYIIKGTMDYFVNGKIVKLKKEEGIFVNSRRLHYGFSNEHQDCTFIALVIHPVLFTESCFAAKNYMHEKFDFQNEDFLTLSPQVSWQKEILEMILSCHQNLIDSPSNPLLLISKAIALCGMISTHLSTLHHKSADTKTQLAFLEMTDYIHSHYDQKINLENIALAGKVCRSKCCILFKKYVKMSPNSYLIQYRLTKSCELLRDTDLTVTQIALSCGFQTASYYTSVFHRCHAMTPQEYRTHLK